MRARGKARAKGEVVLRSSEVVSSISEIEKTGSEVEVRCGGRRKTKSYLCPSQRDDFGSTSGHCPILILSAGEIVRPAPHSCPNAVFISASTVKIVLKSGVSGQNGRRDVYI